MNAELLFKILTPSLAIIGFGIGFWQYRRAQDWKRAEIILSLIDAFKKDPKVQATCLMLDWDRREIQIDEKTRFPFSNDMLVSGLRIIWLDEQMRVPLDATAIASDAEGGGQGFTPDEAMIRDCFDAFFDYFDKVNAFRRSALVKLSDLRYFNYWLESVRRIGIYKKNPAIQTTVNNYLEIYDFKGFREMTAAYNRDAKGLFGIDDGHPQEELTSQLP